MSAKEGYIHILHVEDEEVDHMAVMRVVKRKELSYDIDWAASFSEALEKLRKNSYDVLLLDYQLPDGTGIEVLKRVKGIPAIFITGSGDETVAVKAIKGGAYDYLVKDADYGYLELLPVVIDKALRTLQQEQEHKRAELQIIRQNAELKMINSELSALYEVSSAISHSIDLRGLLTDVLDTVTGLEVLRALKVERKVVIFIVEGERMKLFTGPGQSAPFLDAHKDMKVGDCLCGLAAKTGETIVSKNSLKDPRHTIKYPGRRSHGHIVIPLRAVGGVVGVLCLHLPDDVDVSERTLKLLLSIGDQLGMAISNSMLYEETKSLSLRDPLTGLANRRLFHIELGRSISRAKRYGTPLSIIMMDIDHFKNYNDTYGHPAGDKVLVNISRIVLNEIRETDLFVRYGGEEFILLLPDTGLQDAFNTAERIRERIKERTEITISLGVSSYCQGMERGEDLIIKADEALYKAKEKGRDRVEVSV